MYARRCSRRPFELYGLLKHPRHEKRSEGTMSVEETIVCILLVFWVILMDSFNNIDDEDQN